MNFIEKAVDEYVLTFLRSLREYPYTTRESLESAYTQFKHPSPLKPFKKEYRCQHVFKRGNKQGQICNVILKETATRCTKHKRMTETPVLTQETLKIDLETIVSEDSFDENEIEEEETEPVEEQSGDDIPKPRLEEESGDESDEIDETDVVVEEDDWETEQSNDDTY